MQYIIQAKLNLDVEAKDKDEAKKLAIEEFSKITKVAKVEISEAKVVDRATGYFLE